jgi:DNA-binding response OmpR family regulator
MLAPGILSENAERCAGHLLVLDDDVTFATLFKGALERAGFLVTTAVGGAVAVDAARAERYAALILDEELCATDGLDLVRQVHRRHPNTPVILVTACGLLVVDETAWRLGNDMYLEAPERLTAVTSVVRRAVAEAVL